jgi:hypothetical protein
MRLGAARTVRSRAGDWVPPISLPVPLSLYDPAMNPLSGVLSEAWVMYKTYARHLLTIAFVIYVVAAILVAILSLAGTFGVLLGSIVGLVAAFLLQAALVKAVQDVRDGRVDMSVGQTVEAARPYLGAVIGASLLAGIAIAIGLILVIVPGLVLITIWAVIVPVIVIEQSGALASFGRSRALVRGRGWHVFGTLVLVYVILLVVNFVLGLVFSALPHALGSGLSSVISGTLISPFLALVVTLVYYRLVGTGPASPASGGFYDGGFQQPPPGAPYGGGFHEPPQSTGGYGGYPAAPETPPAGGSYGGYPAAPETPPAGGQNYGGEGYEGRQ